MLNKILVHTCCAPCFAYINEDLQTKMKNKKIEIQSHDVISDFSYTACWYNPTIHPKVEYLKRKDTFVEFCKSEKIDYIVLDEYDLEGFTKDVVNKVGSDKEYTLRCEYCYFTRLNSVFKYASQNGYTHVMTTLAISPYQNHELIKKVGNKLEEKYKIKFVYIDYRENFRKGQTLAREKNLYMQKYCGCIYSIDSRKVGLLMKSYSKAGLKQKRLLRTLLIIFAILLLVSASFLVFMAFNNKVVVENVKEDKAANVSDDAATNSTPIIIDNIVVGAEYNKEWVSHERYYSKAKAKEQTEINAYNATGKEGKFVIETMKKDVNSSNVFITTNRTNQAGEYFAVKTSDVNAMPTAATKIDATDTHINAVKKSNGLRGILNSSVNIREVYECNISSEGIFTIIVATSTPKKGIGAFSSVVCITPDGSVKTIKYSYILNLKESNNFPIYSFKFAGDLNQDNIKELIIIEVKEFDTKYDIIEYKDANFTQILSTEIKNNT